MPFAELPKLPTFSWLTNITSFLPDWDNNAPTVIAAADYVNKWDNTTNISITDINDLVAYSYFYQQPDGIFAAAHKADTISIALSGDSSNILSAEYLGIGTSENPFEGSLRLGSTGSYSLQAYRAFFCYLSDRAAIVDGNGDLVTLSLTRLSDVDTGTAAPVLADHVVHDDNVSTAAQWKVAVTGSCSFSGAIGEIGSGARVNLTFINSAGTSVVFIAAEAFSAEETAASTEESTAESVSAEENTAPTEESTAESVSAEENTALAETVDETPAASEEEDAADSAEQLSITGFMRDGGDDVGAFTGTLDGANGTGTYTITLSTGEPYGDDVTVPADNSYPTAEGVGQIYRHKYNGLFSVLAGTVSNLTVAGVINNLSCVDGMNTGAIAAQNGGAVTLTGVKSTATINDYGDVTGTEAAGRNIGGFIGFVGTDSGITINGTSEISTKINLSGTKNGWNCYGGAIGKITASAFTVTIGTTGADSHKLTNKLSVASTLTTKSSNTDGGGLIGYITKAGSYSGRKVNLNNVEFDGNKVLNPASSNGGGLLGYAWLNTTAAVNGVTVKSAEIKNETAPKAQ